MGETSAAPRPGHTRARVWILVAAFLIVPAAGILYPWVRAGQRLEEARRHVDAEFSRREAAGFDRPPVLEPGGPGDVVDAYAEALQRIGDLPEAVQKVMGTVFANGDLFPADGAPLRLVGRSLDGIAEAVHEALRCRRFRFDLQYRPGLSSWKFRSWDRLYPALLVQAASARVQGREAEALRACVALLGFWADQLRGCEAYWAAHLPDAPLAAVLQLDLLLAGHGLPAAALRDALLAVERIEASLPGIEEAGRLHFLIARWSLLSGDGASVSAPKPGWRYLWSERLVDVAMLFALEEEERIFEGIFALPPDRRSAEGTRWDYRFRDEDRLAAWRNWHGFAYYVDWDVQRRAPLALVKTALALAWHEAETGRPAGRLEDLVPARLAAVPLCPQTGRPFGYAPGKVWWVGYDGGDDGGEPLDLGALGGEGDLVLRVRGR